MSDMLNDSTGGVSTLRVCVLAAVTAGLAIVGCGLVGFFKKLPDATILVGAGQALIVAVLTLKVWQRSVEEGAAK